MSDQQSNPLLARLDTQEARLAAQESTIARLEARLAVSERGPPSLRRRDRKRSALLTVILALCAALVPLGLFAASPFSDLTGGVRDPNIEAIYNAGVTKGCVPDQEYCPTANVTREEMASFLAR